MFLRLARTDPYLVDHWLELLEKGEIRTDTGIISLIQGNMRGEILHIVDKVNRVVYSVGIGSLEVTRGSPDFNPNHLVFDVVSEGDEGSYKYESSIRDLHRSIRSIIKDHRSKRGRLVNLYRQWLGNRTGRIFTAIIGTQIVLMIFHLISAFS